MEREFQTMIKVNKLKRKIIDYYDLLIKTKNTNYF